MKYSGIGGQAVIEGVMMRNKNKYAVAVRKPDGEIEVKTDECGGIAAKNAFFRLPFVRGIVNFIDSLVLGMSTLTYSTSFIEEDEDASKETGEEKTILFGLTGTGYFDMYAYEKFHDGKMSDYIPTDEEIEKSLSGLPKTE